MVFDYFAYSIIVQPGTQKLLICIFRIDLLLQFSALVNIVSIGPIHLKGDKVV